MLHEDRPLVRLYVTNKYYYDCGMLLMTSIWLPTDKNNLREKLKEIQNGDEKDYIVLRGETQFKCSIPRDLDIFKLNDKLNSLSEEDRELLQIIARPGDFSLTRIVDRVLGKKYIPEIRLTEKAVS
ncbi:MAG: hypothetical protein GX111_08185 [Clostridiales bacterium]|nr:hypothetical protein [Clostridiales bacterium]